MDNIDSDQIALNTSEQDIDVVNLLTNNDKFSDLVNDLAYANIKAKELLEVDPISFNSDSGLIDESLQTNLEKQETQQEDTNQDITLPENDNNDINVAKDIPLKPSDGLKADKKNIDLKEMPEAFDEKTNERIKKLKEEVAHLAPPPSIEEKPSEDFVAESNKPLQSADNLTFNDKNLTQEKNIEDQKIPDSTIQDINRNSGENDQASEPFKATKENLKPDEAQNTVKYELPTWTEPEWATKLGESIKKQPIAEVEQTPEIQQQDVTTLENFSELPVAEASQTSPTTDVDKNSIKRPDISGQIQSVFKGLDQLSPALDIFNFKSYINQGIKEGASMAGAPQIQDIPDVESILRQLPFVKQFLPQQEQGGEEIASNSFNFNAPSFIPEIGQKEQPERLTSNSDAMLQDMNQNISKMSVTLQQTQQSLTASLNNLNNTANEILRTIPSISMQQSNGNQQQTNRGKFTPTEELNLIGKFREGLNLSPRQFTNNTVFPGNNSIV